MRAEVLGVAMLLSAAACSASDRMLCSGLGEPCECPGGGPGVRECAPDGGLGACLCTGGMDAGAFDNPEQRGRTPGAAAGRVADASIDADTACVAQSTEARPGGKVDIIFVIDNSPSMGDEIAAVRANINDNFARIIADSHVDFRVILLSSFGTSDQQVCVAPPLGGAPCGSRSGVRNGARFFHYDVQITSVDPWCKILDTLDTPDAQGRARYGWRQWLRPEAIKTFVVITDDSANCRWERAGFEVAFAGTDAFADALSFHRTLLARSPEHFGVPPDIKYRWHSIVGIQSNQPPATPWFPRDEVVADICDSAATPGLSYQALSVVTDSLRYPVCEGRGFDALFRVLSRGVIETATADCVFEFPRAPDGQAINRNTISIRYTSGANAEPERLRPAADSEACSPEHFVVLDDGLQLCPAACRKVKADPEARLDVLYGCFPEGPG